MRDKQEEIDRRLQRYAKLRGWTEGKSFPWQDASDVALGDIMTASLRVQDSLHNAVMSGTPVVAAKALSPQDGPKEEYVDSLLDFQIFTEQRGETKIATLAQQYVEDGAFTAMVSWVKESRRAVEIRKYPPLPPEVEQGNNAPGIAFQRAVQDYLKLEAPDTQRMRPREGGEGWDWDVRLDNGEAAEIKFYAEPGSPTEMWVDRQVTVFDGPLIDPIAWDDVFYPVRCDNLQIPGPSNKGGAGHVAIRSFPSLDEIERLADSKFYDLVDGDDLKMLRDGRRPNSSDEAAKEQKDVMAGRQAQSAAPVPPDANAGTGKPDGTEAHRTLTRLLCFDTYDIDGDGKTEDIVCWVILETRTLLRCRLLSEVFPFLPPRRPLAREPFMPVEGSCDGISLPELMEGYHDLIKIITDQTVDTNTVTGVPFFFYRAAGGNRPEIIKLAPGEGYPLADPSRDVNFPRMNVSGISGGINLMTMFMAQEEKLTNIGDLQLGRVPVGRASALRTVGGMSMVAQQGEARPERILRRFFMGLADIWSMCHQLNQVYLPASKQIRLRALKSKNQEPYVQVTGDDVRMQAIFTFKANAYNASKASLQDAMTAVASIFINPVALQAGVITPDGIYRFFRDIGQAYGVDADQYLTPPSPEAMKPRLLAEEIIHAIFTNQGIPDAAPLEPGGAQEQYARLLDFTKSQQFGLFTPEQTTQLRAYLSRLLEQVRAQAAQARMAEAMAQFQQGRAQPGQRPAVSPQTAAGATAGPPQISGQEELVDETLPGAGGGANQGAQV